MSGDWASLGPIIEARGITVTNGAPGALWTAYVGFELESYEPPSWDTEALGATPLEAVRALLEKLG